MKIRRSLLACVLLPLACAFAPACNGTGTLTPAPQPAPVPLTSVSALRDQMRELWTQHVVWTRVYLIDFIAGLPDTDAATARLLQNQVDIGNSLKPFYGVAAGDKLTTLLHDHITGAVAVVAAAKAGDSAAFAQAQTEWYANADAIAQFLAAANPNWSLTDLQNMMRDHLNRTLAEASARLSQNYSRDILAFDSVEAQILGMADMFAGGISAQFPDLVSYVNQPADADEVLHLTMRRLWEEHVAWTRFYLIDNIAGLADTPETAARLLQNQVDIGNAVKPYYSTIGGEELTQLLEKHILGAVAVVNAAKAGDEEALRSANLSWYANAGEIAQFLAQLNPNSWDQQNLTELMDMHLAQTATEATDRLRMSWTADAADYDAVEAHIIDLADILSEGITTQYPGGPPGTSI